MSVQYDADGSRSQTREDFDFNDREAIVKCVGFSRNQDGQVVVKEQPEFEFYQDNDQWYRRGATREEGSTEVLEDEVVFWPTVYYQFEIVAYQERDGQPGREYVGKNLPYGSKLKGITVTKSEKGWTFSMPGLGLEDSKFRSGLFVVAQKCGFDISAMDPESALSSPEYIADEVATLESPLTKVQIVEKIIEPKLLAAAETGLLLKVHTSERSNWVQYGSITPLTPEQAARYQVSDEGRAEELRAKVREMAQGASPDFAGQILKLALQKQPGVAPSGLLAQLSVTTLEFVLEQLGEPQEVQL